MQPEDWEAAQGSASSPAGGAAPRHIVQAACPHDCPDTCAMQVTVETRGTRRVAVRIAGDPHHPPVGG